MKSRSRFSADVQITASARERNTPLLDRPFGRFELEPIYLLQMAHLTVPATVWKYIEGASKSAANLVMIDLEDSIARDSGHLLDQGRANIIRAFNELNWGSRLRFFRPRGLQLDPGHEDIAVIVEHAGSNIHGLVYPKIESPGEIESLDRTLTALEHKFELTPRSIRIEALIESAAAEERVYEIARVSDRLVGLIFGSYDYWASLGLRASAYRSDHPLLNQARARIVKAAASVGVPAIAEMTTNYPTRDKTETERRDAVEEFRRDALLAREYGFAGKWTGIPTQVGLAVEIFTMPQEEIERAVKEALAFLEVEGQGLGAAIIDGRMADRATDRLNRNTLKIAYALGCIDEDLARKLYIPAK